MDSLSRNQKWQLIGLGAAVCAAVVVRGGIVAVWKATRDDDPPLNPLREESTWTDAVLFSVATGVSVGLARLGARAIASAILEDEGSHLPSWAR